jgi:nucleoside-diphosphate-sugar epimerase
LRKILITGTAGFIGFHLAKVLLSEGFQVNGLSRLWKTLWIDAYSGVQIANRPS